MPLRLNEANEVSSDCIPYSNHQVSRFCQANNFLISASNELKCCKLVDHVLNCTFFKLKKKRLQMFLHFKKK